MDSDMKMMLAIALIILIAVNIFFYEFAI